MDTENTREVYGVEITATMNIGIEAESYEEACEVAKGFVIEDTWDSITIE